MCLLIDEIECVCVYSRYNEFHDLFDKLKRTFADLGTLKLPGKRFIGNNFDPDFIRSRREGLNEFVVQMMKVGVHSLLQHLTYNC